MLLKALKFITPIHRQIECSQCDHQLFTGIGIFLKSSRHKSNMKKSITTGETTPATAFIFTFTNFIFFIFFTLFILFTFFTFFIFFRVKESFSVLLCPIVSWQVLERFDLVTLSQKRTPHSHKREHHHTQNDPRRLKITITFCYIQDPRQRRKLAFEKLLSGLFQCESMQNKYSFRIQVFVVTSKIQISHRMLIILIFYLDLDQRPSWFWENLIWGLFTFNFNAIKFWI